MGLSAFFKLARLIKMVVIFMLVITIGFTTFAQSAQENGKFILGAGLGYNFSLAGGNQGTNISNGVISGIYGSWGEGFTGNIDVGMKTCRNLYAILSLNYLNGKTVESNLFTSNPVQSFSQEFKSHLRVPIVIALGARYYIDLDCLSSYINQNSLASRFVPYLGLGVGVALAGRMTSTLSIEDITNNTVYTLESKSTMTFHPAPVVYGEVGVNYRITNRLSVVAGVRFSAFSLMNSKQRINSYSEDGVDKIPGMTTADLETEFVKDWNSLENQNPDEPTKDLAEKYPVSGLALTCGILFDIGQGGRVQLGKGGKRNHIDHGAVGDIPTPRTLRRKSPLEKLKDIPCEKIKAAVLADACKDCPPINLKLFSNNDDTIFPRENIDTCGIDAWGGAELVNIKFLESTFLNTKCDKKQHDCCCRIETLSIYLTFKLTLNPSKILEGVWLNTNKNDTANFGHTYVGKELPQEMENKQNWKQVDRRSVEVHERQHFTDIQAKIKKVLEEELEKIIVYSGPCGTRATNDCLGNLKKQMNTILTKMKNIANEAKVEIAEEENNDYGKGELEKRARAVQAEELNARGKKEETPSH